MQRIVLGSGSAYRIYVGAYPNDNACIRAIRDGARGNPDCRLVLCSDAGPTTKADCLNRLWRAMAADELAAGFKVKAIVLHDAEDFVHRDELRIFDLLIERAGPEVGGRGTGCAGGLAVEQSTSLKMRRQLDDYSPDIT